MKAKLDELEREAQMAMQQQQGQASFQPKTKGPQKQQSPPKQDSYPRGGGSQPKESYPRGGGSQPKGGQNQRRSRQPIDSAHCPVGGVERTQAGDLASGGSIFDNLEGRLDEAFLLQEVLGPPRCVKGWEE